MKRRGGRRGKERERIGDDFCLSLAISPMAPAVAESYLGYEWYYPAPTNGAGQNETSSTRDPSGLATSFSLIAITPPTRITYNELSCLLFDQLMEL